MEIVGIDPGNEEVKYASRFGVGKFKSAIGEYRNRHIESSHGRDNMIFEFNGRKGFEGTLALAESEFGGSLMGDSKAHEDKNKSLISITSFTINYLSNCC